MNKSVSYIKRDNDRLSINAIYKVMDMKIILEDFFQKFDPINRNTGRIYYGENTYREQVRKKNRMRKIENILSNLK